MKIPRVLPLLVLVFSAQPVLAQEVRGRFVTLSGSPMVGAYVALLRDTVALRSSVTTADGGFRLVAPRPGRYSVEATYIGFETASAEVAVAAGDAVWVELRAEVKPVELEGVVAEVGRRCKTREEDAGALASLWEEVAKAFKGVAAVEDQGLYAFTVERWRRGLSPRDLTVEREVLRRKSGFQTGAPFRALPPDSLTRAGYVQEDGRGGYRYYAPDARVLASRPFLDEHCLGLSLDPPPDGEPGWVGITFRPRGRTVPDIQGALWLDGGTFEPRRLDYRYVGLPQPLRSDAAGGRVVFDRLPEGPWIVRSWRIRMPVVERTVHRPAPDALPRTRYDVVRLTEVGGQVLEARQADALRLAFGARGSVRGVVVDELGSPVAGARVELIGTSFRTSTDPAGRYQIRGVPEGRYIVAAVSPELDSLGLDGTTASVQIVAGEGAGVDVRLRAAGEILAEACARPLEDGGRAALGGRVRGSDGGGSGTEVRVSWTEAVDLSESAEVIGVRMAEVTASVPVRADGVWIACGVPHASAVTLRARRGGATTPTRTVQLEAGEFRRVDFRLADAGALPAVVPLDPITVTVQRRVREDLLDVGLRLEAVGDRYIGPEDVRASLDGARDAADVLARRHLPGVRVTRLEDGLPCVHSPRYKTRDAETGMVVQLCARVVLDGIPVEPERLRFVPPDQVAAMVFLREAEAGARFGVGSEGGVFFVWTHGSH